MFVISNLFATIFRLIHFLVTLFEFAVVARSIMSWFNMDHNSQIYYYLIKITEPVLAPIRKFLHEHIDLGALDLSPWVVILTIEFIVKGFLLPTLRQIFMSIG